MASLRSFTTLHPVGNVNPSNNSQVIAAPAGLAANDFLKVTVWYAQALAASNTVTTPANLTRVSDQGVSPMRLGAVYTTVVTDPSVFAGGITLASNATSTRLSAVAVAYSPTPGTTFDPTSIVCAGPEWLASASGSDTFPAIATRDLTLGMVMSNKSASTTLTTHTPAGGGTLVASALAPSGAITEPVNTNSVSDSVLSVTRGGTGVAFNINQANTLAFTVGINEISDGPTPPPGIRIGSVGGKGAYLTYIDALGNRAVPASVHREQQAYNLLSMDRDIENGVPVYWAHRGGSLNWSEMTKYAYDRAILRNVQGLEFSAQRTSDGVWVSSHDDTLDRVTALTGLINQRTWAELDGVPVDVTGTGGVLWRIEDFLAEYDQHVLVVDPKSNGNINEFAAILKTVPDWQNRVLVKLDGMHSVATWQAYKTTHGFKTAGYWYPNDSSLNALVTRAQYCDYIGMQWDATSAQWATVRSYNKPIWGHVLSNSTQVNASAAGGADIFQCANVTALIPAKP